MHLTKQDKVKWETCKTTDFWTSVAPGEHVLQVYDSTTALLNLLSGFIGGGINNGDSVVVIATKAHLESLDTILRKHGVYVASLVEDNRYIPLDTTETLSAFMVDGWPDEHRFMELISTIVKKARGPENRDVRAFGEMVALLWDGGHYDATLQLEKLWNKFCEQEKITLFCAYPKNNFPGSHPASIDHICSAHAKMISASKKPLTEIQYQVIDQQNGKPIAP